MRASNTPSLVFLRWARVPRTNSWAIDVVTKPQRVIVRSGAQAVTSNAKTSRTAVAQPASTGLVNWSRIVAPEDLRQDRSGPTPVKQSRQSPIGTIHRLKN